ncbi:MAG: TIGR04013 family B12-binding domain/radical SAM domain-containing protein [Calditrichaeota bacterium]|nr:TIGR04013 family B12-binding domain/radical SAM domain-containing protein [Calditrichota bacterium]RQV98593.1 MAG: TIGR04013 family B12-binding domain/radical SAM domain-containing protein [Calditrichota bacterium]
MIKNNRKIALAIRIFEFNRLTIPVILHEIEKFNLDSIFGIELITDTDGLRKFVLEHKSGLIFYSFMTPHLPQIYREISSIKRNENRNLKLVAGGPHTTGDPLSSLKAGFDYAYSGAAESGLVQFLQDYLENRLPHIPAVYQASEFTDLDRSFPISKIFPISPPLEISRGCYWNCRFCQTSCRKTLHRSLNSVRKIYNTLKQRGHNRRINFICPSAFEYGAADARHPEPGAIEELLKFCRAEGTSHLEFGIFPSETRPDTFSEEMVDLISRHCTNRKLTVGMQSGSDRLLKSIRRGHTVKNVENACRIASRSKLQPHADIILGFPGETSDDRKLTLRVIQKLVKNYGARIHLHYFIPLSGTDMSEDYPVELDYRTIDRLRELERDGVCTGWWQDGRKLSGAVVHMRDFLRSVSLEYVTIGPGLNS